MTKLAISSLFELVHEYRARCKCPMSEPCTLCAQAIRHIKSHALHGEPLLRELNVWVKLTGCVPAGGSWHAEMKSFLMRAIEAKQGAEYNEGLVMADLKAAQERIDSLEAAINKHVVIALDTREKAINWQEDGTGGVGLDKVFEESLAELDHAANTWADAHATDSLKSNVIETGSVL